MKRTILECDRCAQHPLDPKRIESLAVSHELAQRLARDSGPVEPPPELPLLGGPVLDLCPKCQEAFVQFMQGPGRAPWPETRD